MSMSDTVAHEEHIAACMSYDGLSWEQWEPAVLTLARSFTVLMVGIDAGAAPESVKELMAADKVHVIHGRNNVHMWVIDRGTDRFLLLTAPVLVPADVTLNAARFLDDDPRIATVSFWSNAAGALSFPYRSGPTAFPTPGATSASVTTTLRAQGPGRPVPIGLPWGAAHFVNAMVVDALGGIHMPEDNAVAASLEGLGAACARRGFRTVLDDQTYVAYSADLCPWPGSLLVGEVEHAVNDTLEHISRLAKLDVLQRAEPLDLAFQSARARVRGLRLIIDASCLGDFEMGTQVQAMALIEALAESADVAYLGVGVPNPELPGYARRLLDLPGVHVQHAPALDFSRFSHVDIVHVPFQPPRLPWEQWTSVSHRIAITIQDLIAYDNASYHAGFRDWVDYRSDIAEAVERSDLVVAISPDVREAIRGARLEVPDGRLVTVDQGTDHLSGLEGLREPIALRQSGLGAAPFILVLGASYAHKNRALAMRAWEQLRTKGYPHELVLVGVTVGRGSDYLGETQTAGRHARGIHLLPDVSSQERNWLFKHAQLVLYPTSAEGFGLVPYEAASFETPTVHVGFGPLADNLPGGPGVSQDWSPVSLATAMKELIDDPALAREVAVRIRQHGDKLTWNRTAERLVQEYLRILAEPSRSRTSVVRASESGPVHG